MEIGRVGVKTPLAVLPGVCILQVGFAALMSVTVISTPEEKHPIEMCVLVVFSRA